MTRLGRTITVIGCSPWAFLALLLTGCPLDLGPTSRIVTIHYAPWHTKNPGLLTYPDGSHNDARIRADPCLHSGTTCPATTWNPATGCTLSVAPDSPSYVDGDPAHGEFWGYSADNTKVITQHIRWLEAMGVDAVVLDMSNGAQSMFCRRDASGDPTIPRCTDVFDATHQPSQFWTDLVHNVETIYSQFDLQQTHLKIIPLIDGQYFHQEIGGGVTSPALFVDPVWLRAELDFIKGLQSSHPNLNVRFEGKPIVESFNGGGASPSTNPDNSNAAFVEHAFVQFGFQSSMALRAVGGLFGNVPSLGVLEDRITPFAPLPEVKESLQVWSTAERLNPDWAYYPAYQRVALRNAFPDRQRVEHFSVTMANTGNGWSCVNPGQRCPPLGNELCSGGWGCRRVDASGNPYVERDPDMSPRHTPIGSSTNFTTRDFVTFRRYMAYARALQPMILHISSFNLGLFIGDDGKGDQGFDEVTGNDIEPNTLWGCTAFDELKAQIAQYKSDTLVPLPPPFETRHGLASAQSNSELWSAAGSINGNYDDAYSSFQSATAQPNPAPYVSVTIAGGPRSVDTIRLYPRRIGGVPVAFPATYDITLRDPAGTWTAIGSFADQPQLNAPAVIRLAQPIAATDVRIIATRLTTDAPLNAPGGYYFQLTELELTDSRTFDAGFFASRSAQFADAQSNDVLWSQYNAIDGNPESIYSSHSYASADPGSNGPWLRGLIDRTQLFDPLVRTIRLYPRRIGSTVVNFPATYALYLSDPQSATWGGGPVGTFTSQPGSTGPVVINLAKPYQTRDLLVTPVVLGSEGTSHYFQLGEIEFGP